MSNVFPTLDVDVMLVSYLDVNLIFISNMRPAPESRILPTLKWLFSALRFSL